MRIRLDQYPTRLFTALLFTSIILFSLSSCLDCIQGSGNVTSESRDVTDFNGIQLNGEGNVYINYGDEESVRIEADDNLHEAIETYVKHGILVIDTKQCIIHAKKLDYYVSVKNLESLKLNGSGLFVSQNRINTNDFNILINGSGTVKLDLQANSVKTKINGSGDIYLKGKANECEIKVSGSGNLDAYKFKVLESYVGISGSGNAYVTVSEKLTVKIAGSGDVFYRGTPKIKSNISGSGSLNTGE